LSFRATCKLLWTLITLLRFLVGWEKSFVAVEVCEVQAKVLVENKRNFFTT
jgi:hypothetical protein